MREIKFRGKRTQEDQQGRWITGCYVKYRNMYGIDVHLIYSSNGYPNDVDPYTVGQFTGLKDKNGVDIIESDRDMTWLTEALNDEMFRIQERLRKLQERL